MPIPVVCPSCAAKMNAPDHLAGKTVKCPKCQSPFAVKAAGPLPAPKPAPPPPRDEADEDRLRPRKPAGDADDEDRPRSRKPARDVDDEPARPRGRRRDDDPDDEESDYDDRPRGQRKKKSALPLVLILCLVGFVGFAAVGAVAYLLVGWTKPVVVPGPGGPIAAGPAGEMALAGPDWVPVEDAEFAFKAAFPNAEPTPFDPLEEIADPMQRDFAAAVMKNMRAKYLHTRDGGRRYMLTAIPMPLNGMSGRVYLGQLRVNLSALHPGFAAEPGPEGESAGHPCQEFTLKGEGKVKVLRVVIAPPGFNYSLMVEGGLDLTLVDPTVQEFFGRFASTRPAAPEAKPKPKTPAPASKDPPPATPVGDWVPFAGSKVKFDMTFPGGAPAAVETFDRVPDPATRNYMQVNWPREEVAWETFETTQGGLRFVVTAFFDAKLKRIAASNAQAARMKMLREGLYENALTRALRSARGNGLDDQSFALALKAGKVIAREVRVGSYSYFLRVEGPPTLHDEDPTVWHFLTSLKWPEDAVPKKK